MMDCTVSKEKLKYTTTTYGVMEQWAYRSNRYIHLDNGIVTATLE